MKRRFLILAVAAVCSLLPSCTKENPFDDTEIWEAIEALKTRIAAVEKSVAENVSAIQSMISVGSIASWEYDAQTGKGTITLVDGKKITVNQTTKGYSLITVEKDSEGNYYWAICKDGVSTPLEIDGKKVPVAVTPSLKISEDNEWMISVDGGKTWVKTGIQYQDSEQKPEAPDTPAEPETPEVVFFQDVKMEGEYLVLTLADGTPVKVAVVGEATFTAAAETLWFSRASMQKSVAVEMLNVKAFTITEKPDGWKVSMDDSYIYVTSPADFTVSPKSGTVKALAVFENGSPEILQLAVSYEPMFKISYVNGAVSVTLSENTGEDFNGYVLMVFKKDEYTLEGTVNALNAEATSHVLYEGSNSYSLSDLVADYDEAKDYIVVAAPYLPGLQVAQGALSYTASDIQTVTCRGLGQPWTFSNIRYDAAELYAVMDEAGFFGGFFELAEWNSYGRDNFLETLGTGGAVPYTMTSYKGQANGFPTGEVYANINPATEYVVWYLPVNESEVYTADDFIIYTFITPDVSFDSSIAAPQAVTRDVTSSGFTADVTPAAGTYKTYAAIMKAAAIPESDYELVTYLINADKSSAGSEVNTITSSSFSPEDQVYLVAVSVTEDGKYGNITKTEVKLNELVFTSELGVEVTDIQYGLGDVTLSLSFKGDAVNLIYSAATYTYYEDDYMQKLLALGQLGTSTSVKIEKLDGKLHLTGLTLGAEHTFYAVVTDAEGNSSYLYKYTFVPTNNIDYVTSKKSNYKYGMPQFTSTIKGTAASYTLTLDVEMPAECKKYWLFKGDYEYFTGDEWTDSDMLVTQQYMDVTVHETSVKGLVYEFMNPASRIYTVWLDDKGDYHAIYEYNPRKN